MARRNEEEFAEKRSQILAGALQVFATHGFAQATNRDIAAAAGINSPGLIYHYFRDKADLLRAVAEEYAPPLQLISHAEEILSLPPRDALTRFALTYLRLTESPQVAAFFRLAIGQALRDPAFARMFGEIGPLRFWQFLADYLRGQMDTGVLRRADPTLAAQCFLGPLLMQLLACHVLQLLQAQETVPETLVALHVEIFLRGLQPE